jgi:hypothetical protein
LRVFKQIVEGIQYMHHAGIIQSKISATSFIVQEKPDEEQITCVFDLRLASME